MTISINDKFPTQEIRVLVDGEIKNITSDEYFSGKMERPYCYDPMLRNLAKSHKGMSIERPRRR